MTRYSKWRANSGHCPAAVMSTGAIAVHAGASGGDRSFHAIAAALARVAPRIATAWLLTSPCCDSAARSVDTFLPCRSTSTAMSTAPCSTGPGSSAVTERTLRAGSADRISIARTSAPTTSPPNAPRPWRHSAGTSSWK